MNKSKLLLGYDKGELCCACLSAECTVFIDWRIGVYQSEIGLSVLDHIGMEASRFTCSLFDVCEFTNGVTQ
jgi:hypothetical protein